MMVIATNSSYSMTSVAVKVLKDSKSKSAASLNFLVPRKWMAEYTLSRFRLSQSPPFSIRLRRWKARWYQHCKLDVSLQGEHPTSCLLLRRLDVSVDHAVVIVEHAKADLGKYEVYPRSNTSSLLQSSIQGWESIFLRYNCKISTIGVRTLEKSPSSPCPRS